MSRGRRRLTLAVLVCSGTLMCCMSGARFVLDASFWNDEAKVAYNVISMDALSLFGPLDSGHQFPRLYLAAINLLRLVFGYETMTMRALPFIAFVAGVVLWHRILWLRFAARPGIALLGCVLCLVPGDWFAYGAMFKQYSLEVALAMMPFLLRDETLERRWHRGERSWRLLPWLLPCMLSMSYGIAVLGRLAGYALGTARVASRASADSADRVAFGPAPRAKATATWVLGLVTVMAASFWLDLRHAFAHHGNFHFWQSRGCIATGDLLADAGLLARWPVEWFVGKNTFGGAVPVPDVVAFSIVALGVIGAAHLIVSAWRGRTGRPGRSGRVPEAASACVAWGTRGLSALVTVAGLWMAALLFGLPVCANRLTLFAFFSLVLVVLEGASFVVERAEASGVPAGRGAELLAVALSLAVAPAAASTAHVLMTVSPPENLRGLLPLIAAAPDRTIVVGRCSGVTALTLPEWLDRDDIVYTDLRVRSGEPAIPVDLTEFWLVNAGGHFRCPGWTRRLRDRAVEFTAMASASHSATLHRVRLPVPEPALGPRAPTPALETPVPDADGVDRPR